MNRTHFIDYSVASGPFDFDYLEAAFNNDTEKLREYETLALQDGFGPLASCNTIANPSSVRVHCRQCCQILRNSITY